MVFKQQTMNKIKLHLGCGNKHIDGYINIDIRYMPGVDSIDNVERLRRYKENSVSVIYASHVLEHICRYDYMHTLQRWYELLMPDGILRIGVPDFEAIANYYIKTKDLRSISGMLYGGQDYKENFHCWCWDFDTLSRELKSIGFKDIKRYDWRTTEHSHIDDYTQIYIPHMDKENGMLFSLNIEAIK
jgi:predicted SAM-dependent methyltransferase